MVITILPLVVLVWVFVTAIIEHLNAILVAGSPVKPVIQLHKHREVATIVFPMTILKVKGEWSYVMSDIT